MNMKTKSFLTKSDAGRRSRRASLAAAIVAASALVIAHSVFAQSESGFIAGDSAPLGSAPSFSGYTPPLSFGPPSNNDLL
jgi:hypothetical protein